MHYRHNKPSPHPHTFTHVHGQYAARDEFTVLSDAEVPRFYPHHVVKHELQVQTSFYADLQRVRAARSAPGEKFINFQKAELKIYAVHFSLLKIRLRLLQLNH